MMHTDSMEDSRRNEVEWKLRTVKELAGISGVSVRTLHHYDEIGLLKPRTRSDAGYRLYGKDEYLRLQQILFYRELGVTLKEIGIIIDAPEFDRIRALQQHRKSLLERRDSMNVLLLTLDKTLELLEDESMLKEEELYEGFTGEEISEIKKEVREKYDPVLVAESERRVRKMSRDDWILVKEEGDRIARELVVLMNLDPASTEVQNIIARHHRWIENFYDCSMEIYRGLASLYTEDIRFRAFYENYADGLPEFLKEAMLVFSDRN